MPSIHPDYEYDIFISYRQNDNKRDGWVTSFVAALRDELEATLKNPVSIYFDENPHDGLLETHLVNDSLKKKLKCLVLIPIISQTFCDTKSFAWEHEFLPFKKMAKEDSLGMNISLPNGNVASRVLPIKIHVLDTEDEELLAQELDGPLRAIDFIYKEPGVNRPLKPEDTKEDNINNTNYANQINKVANALKEIGTSILKNLNQDKVVSPKQIAATKKENTVKSIKTKISLKMILGVLFLSFLLLAGYYFINSYYTKISTPASVENSIAVLPFRNESKDPANIYFCNGIMEDIINQLSQIPNVRVPSATSMLYYRDNPKPVGEIIDELNVNYLLEASVRKMADRAVLNITLIDANENHQIWTDRMEIDLSVKELFDIQFEVANTVASKMRITLENTKGDIPTDNYQAYDNYIKARDFMRLWDIDKNRVSINLLHAAIELDPDFLNAYTSLGQAYGQKAELTTGGYWVDSARHYSTIAFNMNKKNPSALNALAYATVLEGKPKAGLQLYLESYSINSNSPYNYAGWCYMLLNEFEKAARWAIQNISMDPKNSIYYIDMGNATNALGLFEYTVYYSKKALEINGDHGFAYNNLKEMELSQGHFAKALEIALKRVEITKAPVDIADLGTIYYKMDSLEKARHFIDTDFTSSFDNASDNDDESIRVMYRLLQFRALIHIKSGDEAKGVAELEDLIQILTSTSLEDRSQYALLLAGCYAALGDTNNSLLHLEKLNAEKYNDYYELKTNSLFDSMRANPQFLEVIQKIKNRNEVMRENILSANILKK